MKIKPFEWIFREHPEKLLQKLSSNLKTNNAITHKEFFYRPGKIPVLLVAHVDTVHRTPPHDIYYDQNNQVMWSPQGLGADDRAGVLGIMWLLQAGFSPHILFTDGEESGGTGARAATKELPAPKVSYAIQLDRKNGNEAVFYNCDNPEFTKHIEEAGYKTTSGIFSDISILCPHWQIAGVNLSCGYYEHHTKAEYLKINELRQTVTKVKHLLQNVPPQPFKYVPAATHHYFSHYDHFPTHHWKKQFPAYQYKNFTKHYKDYEPPAQRFEKCDICGSYVRQSEIRQSFRITYCNECWLAAGEEELTCCVCYTAKHSSYFRHNPKGDDNDICLSCWSKINWKGEE